MGLTLSTEEKSLLIDGVEINITRKFIKTLRMRILPPDGKVKLSAPMFVSKKNIKQFVNSQLGWIRKYQQYYQSQPKPAELYFSQGEEHYFLGSKYRLELINQFKGKQQVVFDGHQLKMYVRTSSSVSQKEKLLSNWYRAEIKKRVPVLLAKWQPLMGKKVLDWRIKKMKTRWGTCNINKKRIWLNLELIKKSPECIEYVLVHEMLHLYERYHNQRFYRYMDQFLPNWKSTKKRLNCLS